MLAWLASYPRSGNTLVRTILNQCLDIGTRSMHGDGDNRIFNTSELQRIVGHQSSDVPDMAQLAAARQTRAWTVVKTHEMPPTDDKSIYIVRNGISSMASYYHFLKDFEHVELDIRSIIRGDVYAGSWSDHVRQIGSRPGTLLLRYENIAADPNAAARQIAGHLGVEQKRDFLLTFTDMHKAQPNFFRRGDDRANVKEMLPYMDLIEEYHGETLRQFGYRD
ncbi:hypothetical protein EJV44_23340 [Ancylobacter aquaticus]|nr:hypothetical protein EJV44_23340 [Ancylobacter aquaticus]